MGRFLLGVVAIGLSVIGASFANAASKGSGNSSGPAGLATGNPNVTTSTTTTSTTQSLSDTALGSTGTTTPVIEPSGSDDKVNVRGTIFKLPF